MQLAAQLAQLVPEPVATSEAGGPVRTPLGALTSDTLVRTLSNQPGAIDAREAVLDIVGFAPPCNTFTRHLINSTVQLLRGIAEPPPLQRTWERTPRAPDEHVGYHDLADFLRSTEQRRCFKNLQGIVRARKFAARACGVTYQQGEDLYRTRPGDVVGPLRAAAHGQGQAAAYTVSKVVLKLTHDQTHYAARMALLQRLTNADAAAARGNSRRGRRRGATGGSCLQATLQRTSTRSSPRQRRASRLALCSGQWSI